MIQSPAAIQDFIFIYPISYYNVRLLSFSFIGRDSQFFIGVWLFLVFVLGFIVFFIFSFTFRSYFFLFRLPFQLFRFFFSCLRSLNWLFFSVSQILRIFSCIGSWLWGGLAVLGCHSSWEWLYDGFDEIGLGGGDLGAIGNYDFVPSDTVVELVMNLLALVRV